MLVLQGLVFANFTLNIGRRPTCADAPSNIETDTSGFFYSIIYISGPKGLLDVTKTRLFVIFLSRLDVNEDVACQ